MSNKIELSLAKAALGISVEEESLACSFRRCPLQREKATRGGIS